MYYPNFNILSIVCNLVEAMLEWNQVLVLLQSLYKITSSAVDLNISTVAWSLPYQVLTQIYAVLVVFYPHKMPPHLSGQQRPFICNFIDKPILMWKPRGDLPKHFHEHVFLPKTGEITWKSLTNMVLSDIGIRSLVVPKKNQRQSKHCPVRRTLRQNHMLSWCCKQHLKCVNLSKQGKLKQGFHRFSIMMCHSLTKRNIIVILSKHKVNIITKTMQVKV